MGAAHQFCGNEPVVCVVPGVRRLEPLRGLVLEQLEGTSL